MKIKKVIQPSIKNPIISSCSNNVKTRDLAGRDAVSAAGAVSARKALSSYREVLVARPGGRYGIALWDHDSALQDKL